MSDLSAQGVRQRWTFDTHPPRDGEELAGLVYHDDHEAWIYPAAYDDYALCYRRAESLSRSFAGVPFTIYQTADGCYAGTDRANTQALQQAIASVSSRFDQEA